MATVAVDFDGWESKSAAYRAVARALKDTLGKAPGVVRQLELGRLDSLWRETPAGGE